MKVLSLFDGMACGMLAMQKVGIEVDRYVAYEIDKYAVQTSSNNFPMIEHMGDVFQADFTEFSNFDFLVGGSPCTYWSIAQTKNRETVASGMGWELFSQYVRALHEAQPLYFIYENNKSMSAAIRASITETFGFEPICINSALVSAQNRQRLYWVGKRNPDGTYSKVHVDQPEDRGILLKDVLDRVGAKDLTAREMDYMVRQTSGVRNHFDFGYIQDATRDKGACVTANISKGVPYNVCCEPVRVGTYPNNAKNQSYDSQQYRIYSTEGKSVTLCGNGGGMGAKTGLYATPICHTIPQEVRVRKYTCDIGKFQTLLRESKKKAKLTNKQIADQLDRPQTEVEHWFRTDKHFSIPDEDVWFGLKKLLNIQTTEFDDFVTVFEVREGIFEKSNRCYDVNGKMSTLMTGKTDNIIAPSIIDGRPVYEVKDGLITIKGRQYPIKLADGFYIIRKLTVRECMRLQTVPEWYEFPVSDTQVYKMLGNGWTVDVIAHLLEGCVSNE